MKTYEVEYTYKGWGFYPGPDMVTARTEALDGEPTPEEAQTRLAEKAHQIAPNLFVGCRVLRESTPAESRRFFAMANAAYREVEAQERHGSTKTLPKGWRISGSGRTLNQFGDPA